MRRPSAALLGVATVLWLGAAPALAQEAGENDPLEPFNRGVFWVNDRLDRYFLEPIATGWEVISPEFVRVRIDKFLTNLRFPVRFFSNLCQLKLRQTGAETGRFIVNTTAGIAGFFDPATRFGIGFYDEDFGQALGYWGTPAGPYLVLPIIGPSSPRDAVGWGMDWVLLLGPTQLSATAGVVIGGTNMVNSRAMALEDVREAKAAALDYYVLVRNGYIQLREAKNRDGEVDPDEPTESLYDFDIDEEIEE